MTKLEQFINAKNKCKTEFERNRLEFNCVQDELYLNMYLSGVLDTLECYGKIDEEELNVTLNEIRKAKINDAKSWIELNEYLVDFIINKDTAFDYILDSSLYIRTFKNFKNEE